MADEISGGGNAPTGTSGAGVPGSTPATTPSTGAGDPGAGAASSEIEFAGRKFKSYDEAAKSHAELNKAFTQRTQELATYKRANAAWLDRMTKLQRENPSAYANVMSMLRGGQAQQSPGVQQPDPRLNELSSSVESLQRSLEEQRVETEINNFKAKYNSLDDTKFRNVVQYVIDRDNEGRHVTMEEAYRHLYFDEAIEEAKSAAKKEIEESMKKGRKATTLGSNPASVKNIPSKLEPYPHKGGPAVKNAWLAKRANELGLNLGSEDPGD